MALKDAWDETKVKVLAKGKYESILAFRGRIAPREPLCVLRDARPLWWTRV